MHVLDKCRTGFRLLTTYLPIVEEVSLEEIENVGRVWVTLGKKCHLQMAGDSLSPIMITLSSREES